MEPELWHRVKEVCQGAWELDEDRRAEFVERSCGNDLVLRREVESLLAQEKIENYRTTVASPLQHAGLSRLTSQGSPHSHSMIN